MLYKKLSLENLEQVKKSKDRVYQEPRQVPRVSGTRAEHNEKIIKKYPSTPDLIFRTKTYLRKNDGIRQW